jgi:hypothetical protein
VVRRWPSYRCVFTHSIRSPTRFTQWVASRLLRKAKNGTTTTFSEFCCWVQLRVVRFAVTHGAGNVIAHRNMRILFCWPEILNFRFCNLRATISEKWASSVKIECATCPKPHTSSRSLKQADFCHTRYMQGRVPSFDSSKYFTRQDSPIMNWPCIKKQYWPPLLMGLNHASRRVKPTS